MEKEFSSNYDPKEYKEDERFRIAYREAKIVQLFYFIPTILTVILIYTLSPKLGEPAKLFMGMPLWFAVVRLLWLVMFVVMLIYLKIGVKTVSFNAREEEEGE